MVPYSEIVMRGHNTSFVICWTKPQNHSVLYEFSFYKWNFCKKFNWELIEDTVVLWFGSTNDKRCILASHNNHHSEFSQIQNRILFCKWKCTIPAPLIGLGRYFHKIWCKITGFWCTKPLSGNCQVGVFRPFLQRSLVQFRKQLVFLSVIHVWTTNLFTFSLCPCDSKMIEYEIWI